MTRILGNGLLASALLAAALYPTLARRREAEDVMRRLEVFSLEAKASLPFVGRRRLSERSPNDHASSEDVLGDDASGSFAADPALFVRVDEAGSLLASWQTIGGCGSSGATGSAGIKWIGRGATGGLFNVQVQANYSELGSAPYKERNLFLNTLLTRDIGQKWNVGINIPFVYKYLQDPLKLGGPGNPGIDYSNGGLGDVSVQATHKFGAINDTLLTLVVGLPTGTYQETFNGIPYSQQGLPLHQQQQLGFGRVTGSLILDHTFDRIWGVMIVGAVGSYRGGQNAPLENYRSPSATGYYYAGYFWGPFVPAIGLSVTGFQKHDRDLAQDENSGLLVMAPNFSLEWSTDWMAVLAGVSFPYQYDGITTDTEGRSRSPWGWAPWLAALGLAFSPF